MSHSLYFRNARLICPASNRDEIGFLLVKDGLIADIGAGECSDIPQEAKVIDCAGQILCPGLVDMRVQSQSIWKI